MCVMCVVCVVCIYVYVTMCVCALNVLVHTLQQRAEESLVIDAFAISAAHSCLAHTVMDTDCWEQNGSAPAHVLVSFKHQFLTEDEKIEQLSKNVLTYTTTHREQLKTQAL